MPELPEVETVVRTLELQLQDKTILDVNVYWPNLLENSVPAIFENSLRNEQFTRFSRRGKFLIFTLTNYVLVVHLRMEGKFYIYHTQQEKGKHDHIIFKLNDCYIHYNDTRKFGRFYLYPIGANLDCLDGLGKEPFDPDLNGLYLKQLTKNNKNYIKSVLLDQSIIAGIGNIYADEILFACHLNPYTKACFISINKWQEIIEQTIRILSKAIMCGGTTIRSYTSSLGVTGRFQLNLKVHSKGNELCSDCQNTIIREKINTRSCFYCPNCQKSKAIKVAITGTIGSGKSMVTSFVKKMGYKVCSCDEINHELLKQKEVKEQLCKILNCSIEQLTNQYIAQRIYTNFKLKQEIEEYLHGLIFKQIEIFFKENENEELVFVEVPLLFETFYYLHFDQNWLVKTNREKIEERLMRDRSMSKEQIDLVIQNQMSVEKKEQLADVIIENNSSLTNLRKTVENKIDGILKLK